MPPTTYLQSILCYFCIMDIDLLRYYLKDKYTYQEATKEVFLDKIEGIFEKHRVAGDTELWLFPGACAGIDCENCGKKGYRFVGNHSKNYLNLIFEMTGNDITDIYSCSQFRSDTDVPDLGSKSSIEVDLDERTNFPKPQSYWTRVYAAQGAYSELITIPPRKLTFEELKYWLDKHAGLYRQIGEYRVTKPRVKWTPFHRLYYDLTEIGMIISENIDQIRQANQAFKKIESDQELIEWVMLYEKAYHEGTLEMQYFLVKNGEDYGFAEFDQYLFTGEVFAEVYVFFDSFEPHHTELISKYSIYTDDEEDEVSNKEDWNIKIHDRNSLRFHLGKRKEMEELGIHLPFYLRNENKQTDSIDVPF